MSRPELELSDALRQRLAASGLEFLAECLELETQARPANIEALAELGHVYTALGRVEQGLGIDRRLCAIAPEDPNVHYNLACSLALLQREDDALDALERAIRLGYADLDFLEGDADLSSLREAPRFRAIVARLRSRA